MFSFRLTKIGMMSTNSLYLEKSHYSARCGWI